MRAKNLSILRTNAFRIGLRLLGHPLVCDWIGPTEIQVLLARSTANTGCAVATETPKRSKRAKLEGKKTSGFSPPRTKSAEVTINNTTNFNQRLHARRYPHKTASRVLKRNGDPT